MIEPKNSGKRMFVTELGNGELQAIKWLKTETIRENQSSMNS